MASCAFALLTSSAGAVVIPVTTTADGLFDDNECGLREAITAANSNSIVNDTDDCNHTGALEPDTITVPGGTYELDQTAPADNTNLAGDLDVSTNTATQGDLTIDGAGATTTTIDTDDMPAWTERVLHHVSTTGTLTVTDLTITDGNAGAAIGGGILNAGGALALNGVRVTANTGDQGGGIATQTPSTTSLSIVDSTIDNNTATGLLGSGGVFSNATTTNVDSTVILGNTATSPTSAPEGGGMEADSTTLTMTDSVVADNHLIDSAGTDAALFGGGLKISGGSATVRGTTFSDNEATGGALNDGGGIQTSGNLTLVNSTLSGNQALGGNSDGGGLFVSGGTTNVIHTTFGPNPVADSGSAIFNVGGTPVAIRGSVIETSGAASACGTTGGGFTSGDDNVVTDTTCIAETGNDDTDADPALAALASNGGINVGAPGFLEVPFTHLPGLTSPAIDHVPAANCDDELANPLGFDQRGVPRPQFFPSGACDAGSVERNFRLLTAAKAGSGTGMVSGGGIDCGIDCSTNVLDGTAVVLTATADAGSTFTGWTGCDNPVGNQCTQTVSGGNETVTANFTANPPPSTGGGSTPTTTPAPAAPKRCKKGRKLKKGKCVKKKTKK